MTPIRRQYLKIKHSFPDAIVLFRMGDFYETFDEDAHVASKELEITLTSRSMGKNVKVPMAGFPAHAVESYLAKLVKRGHKVAICEQLSVPDSSKGLVERDVVRVVTPGTVLESALLDQKVNNYLAAVVLEGDSAGFAYADVTTGEFAAAQLDRSQLPLELERISPAEVLSSDIDTSDSEEEFPSHKGQSPTEVDYTYFELETAQQALLDHYGILSLESFGCEHLPLAVRAAGAIVLYLRDTRRTGKLHLMNLGVYSTSGFMDLDVHTRRNLELFTAGRNDRREHSLLATLDQTRTPMGGRLLRRWLGQPLLDLEELERRLDAVSYFFNDAFLRAGAGSSLSRVPDLERILARIKAGVVAPRELIALKSGLDAVPELLEQLSTPTPPPSSPRRRGTKPPVVDSRLRGNDGLDDGNDGLDDGNDGLDDDGSDGLDGNDLLDVGQDMAWLRQQLTPLPEICGLIEQSIAPEPVGNPGEGNVIRQGFSPELDALKYDSQNARNFIAGLEQTERARTGLRGLKIGYNHVFGYYIEVSKSNQAQVPDNYIRRQTLVNSERYITPEIKEYESLVLNARERIEEMERSLFRRVCEQVSETGDTISRLAKAVAMVDVFVSLAEVAVANGYVRPQLDLNRTISIKNGRHPALERLLDRGTYVPNDVYLSNDDARIILLTGPNMAGKSTFIRQAAIIVLMAQVGSYVPASEAIVGLVDRIFTRVGLQDDLTTGQSTFMVEMVETAAILNQATPRSLVVLDEIGRGTSTYDGLSIARSVIEHLHNDERLGCKTLFATHYHELTELAGTLPGVRNFTVAVTEEDSDVVFLHRIVPGGADKSYGVHVARLAGLPQGVVNRAWEVLADLEDTHNSKRKAGGRRSRKAADLQMPLFDPARAVADEVKALDIPNLTPLEAINCLYELQRKARELTGSS